MDEDYMPPAQVVVTVEEEFIALSYGNHGIAFETDAAYDLTVAEALSMLFDLVADPPDKPKLTVVPKH